ncbi:MAG: hypothetical protein HYX82_04850 [Chloroflexi bacterium]|nr:hypothetical protein [Chloroflexota bacterium]
MKTISRFFKIVGYGILGVLVIWGFLLVLLVGGFLGAYWYFTHNQVKATMSIPITDEKGQTRNVVLDLTNEEWISKEDLQRVLNEGVVQTHFQFFVGPKDFKVGGMRLVVRVPIEQFVGDLTDSLRGELIGTAQEKGLIGDTVAKLEEELGVEHPLGLNLTKMIQDAVGGALGAGPAQFLFRGEAGKTATDLLAMPKEDLIKLFGPDYQRVINDIFAGATDKTLAEVFSQDPKRAMDIMKNEVPPQNLRDMANTLFGEQAKQTMGQIQASVPPEQLKTFFGEDYLAEMQRVFGGSTTKTLGDVFVEDPWKVVEIIERTQKGMLLQGILGGLSGGK